MAALALFVVLLPGLALFVFYYVYVPLLVKKSLRFPRREHLTPIEPDTLLGMLSPLAIEVHRQLLRLGFNPILACSAAVGREDASNYLSAYVRKGENETVVLGYARVGESQMPSLQIFERSEDGRFLSLSNAPFPGIYRSWARRKKYRVPDEWNVEAMLGAYRKIAKNVKAFVATPVTASDAIRTLEAYYNEDLDELIRSGLVNKPIGNDLCAPSVIGAFLTTAYTLWPVKGVMNWLEKRRRQSAAKA